MYEYFKRGEFYGIKVYEVINTDIYYNLAFESYIFETIKKDDFSIIFYKNTDCLVIGKHQNLFLECNINYTKENNIKIARRESGGGTVFQDLGNLNYSFIGYLDLNDKEKNFDILMKSIKNFNISLTKDDKNSLFYKNLKVSGSAFRLSKNKFLHHGTLLLNTNLSKLNNSINIKNINHNKKNIYSNYSKTTNLKDISDDIDETNIKKQILINSKFYYGKIISYTLIENNLNNYMSKKIKLLKNFNWIYNNSEKRGEINV
ncbi:MAG: lipoate---protein ligase [Oceanotoga sp.]|uniref:lipoate--protein ligase family protein n=1 Tax=Oceanotoga sp. TaxID=2108366 RepID=UPI0026565292|nr:lipoate--protein ligase family protein [Oceanotoga sp.]MDN5342551.1 lipoate---protein ligase [Oceanotoga sp.]